ncbi:MAG: L,D-transpeptidase family protein [Smithellaceae bacterium]
MRRVQAADIIFSLCFVIALFVCVAPCPAGAAEKDLISGTESGQEESTQLLLVFDHSFLFFTRIKLYAFARNGATWHQAMKPMSATIGANGFAPHGEKREGDGRTPSGRYRLGTAFGYPDSMQTRMPYRQAFDDDIWVDDPVAPDYNQWVKLSDTAARSFEKMRRDDDQYKYGIVIEHNTAPVIPGHGSAIFLHIWKAPGASTAGCIAVSEENIINLLGWLDPKANPLIVINPEKSTKEFPL